MIMMCRTRIQSIDPRTIGNTAGTGVETSA